ncbi:MAG: hypothetical protein ABGZ53_06950 [Fuerstiella sp.]
MSKWIVAGPMSGKAATSIRCGNMALGSTIRTPNTDRRRQGLDPVNFDGKTDRERGKKGGAFGNMIGDMLGDMFLYSIKSTFNAVVTRLRR